MGEKLKLEVSKAKKRKEEQKPPSKADLTAKKTRININKRLAPHYYGEIGIPMSWLRPPLKKLANRDYNPLPFLLQLHLQNLLVLMDFFIPLVSCVSVLHFIFIT